jgi:serine/threonine protein kinase
MTSSISPKRSQEDMMGDSSFSCSENSGGEEEHEEGESSPSQSQSSSAKHRKRFGGRTRTISSCGLPPQGTAAAAEAAAATQYGDFSQHQEEIKHDPTSSFQYQPHNAAQHHYQYSQQQQQQTVVPGLIKTRSDNDTPLSFVLHQQQYQRTTCGGGGGGGGIGCKCYRRLASSYPSYSHCNHNMTSSSSSSSSSCRQYYYQHQLHNHHNHKRTDTGPTRNATITSSCSSSSSTNGSSGGGESSTTSRSASLFQQPHHQASLPPQASSNYHTNNFISNRNNNNNQMMKRVIVDTIRENFRLMLEGTRLIRKMDEIQLLRPDDVLPTNNLLGTGAFSQVTSVVLKDTDNDTTTTNTTTTTEKKKYYACKQLKKELFTDPPDFFKAATELVYEAHVLSSFDHPNIIKLRGWAADGIDSFANAACDNDDVNINISMGMGMGMGGNSNNNSGYGTGTSAVAQGENGIATATTTTIPTSFFLIMDVLRETLDQRIDRWKTIDRPQSLAQFHQRNIEKLSLCKQLAGALEYIHFKNVVYRDLKPQNVGFCTEGGNLKLFDFGLCRELPVPSSESASTNTNNSSNNNNNVDPNERFQLSGMVGTMRYMAPEVCLNQPYNRDCDIYSWSIVSWEILSQAKPFETFTPDLYTTLVCMQGVRPTDLPMTTSSSSPRPRSNTTDGHGENANNIVVDNISTVTAVPQELKVLLKQAWRGEPTQRIRLSQVQSQLALFRQLEELRLEEQELQDNSSSSSFGENFGEGEEEDDGGDDLTPVTNTNGTANSSFSSTLTMMSTAATTTTEEDEYSFSIPSPRTNNFLFGNE